MEMTSKGFLQTPRKASWEDSFSQWLARLLAERATQRKTREIRCVAGGILLKLLIDASERRDTGETEFSCSIIEIDGRALEEQARVEGKRILVLPQPPTVEQQQQLIQEVLEFFHLPFTIVPVSEHYARGHLRMLSLQHALAPQKNGAGLTPERR